MGNSDGEKEIEILSPEKMREVSGVLPQLDGVTIWRKALQCEFCTEEFLDTEFRVYVLQWQKRSDIHLMCQNCFSRMVAQPGP